MGEATVFAIDDEKSRFIETRIDGESVAGMEFFEFLSLGAEALKELTALVENMDLV